MITTIQTLNGTARAKHENGVKRLVVVCVLIPGIWASFLGVDANKTELFSFL